MINRRELIQLFAAALAGGTQLPAAAVTIPTPEAARRTTAELLSDGVSIVGIGVALVRREMWFPRSMEFGCSFDTHWYREDIAEKDIISQAQLTTVTIDEHGCLDADDAMFTCITGVECGLLFWLHFRDGSTPVLSFQTSDDVQPHCKFRYCGVPLTPNGGNVMVVWPNDRNKIVNLGRFL